MKTYFYHSKFDHANKSNNENGTETFNWNKYENYELLKLNYSESGSFQFDLRVLDEAHKITRAAYKTQGFNGLYEIIDATSKNTTVHRDGTFDVSVVLPEGNKTMTLKN